MSSVKIPIQQSLLAPPLHALRDDDGEDGGERISSEEVMARGLQPSRNGWPA